MSSEHAEFYEEMEKAKKYWANKAASLCHQTRHRNYFAKSHVKSGEAVFAEEAPQPQVTFDNSDDGLATYITAVLGVGKESEATLGYDEFKWVFEEDSGVYEKVECECGSEACGSSNHSSWCPKYGGG